MGERYYCTKCKRHHIRGNIYKNHMKWKPYSTDSNINQNQEIKPIQEIKFNAFERIYGKRKNPKITIFVGKNVDLSILNLYRIRIEDPNVNIRRVDNENEEYAKIFFNINDRKYLLKEKDKLYDEENGKVLNLFRDEFSWLIYPDDSPMKIYSPEILPEIPPKTQTNPTRKTWSDTIRSSRNIIIENKRTRIKDIYEYLGGAIYGR
jgi:hypothetical protein